jgi:twinfilin
MTQLQAFKDGTVNFVQFSLNFDGEVIELAQAGTMSVDEASALCPPDAARYCLYNFKHTHDGEDLETIIFVYSCPAFELPVRDRMLYASCKSPLLDVIEKEMEIAIVKKMEIENGTEFTHEEFYKTLHPIEQVHSLKFARPKGPGGRKGASSRARPQRGSSGSGPSAEN